MHSHSYFPVFRFSALLLAMTVISCATPTPSPATVAVAVPPETAPSPDAGATVVAADPNVDPYLWLEDVTAEKSLTWVKANNAISQKELEAEPSFSPLRDRLLSIYTSKDRIPGVTKRGKYFYNFWKDDVHVRGIARRTTLKEYKKANPVWETILDLDALSKAEKENWVYKGEHCLFPKYDLCLVLLSRGGADATVVREFNIAKKDFVKDGFYLPEGKSEVAWKDENTLYVAADFGPGTMTDSGYPRTVREWKRGQPLAQAKVIFEGQQTDVEINAWREWDHGLVRDFISRGIAFFNDEVFLMRNGKNIKIDKPNDAIFGTWADQALFQPRTDWVIADKTYAAGSLLIIKLDDFLSGKRNFQVLFRPTEHQSLSHWTGTKTALFLNVLDDVKTKLWVFERKGKEFAGRPLEGLGIGTYDATPVEANESDDYWLTSNDFLSPMTLSMGNTKSPKREQLKHSPAFFKADGLVVEQHFVSSKDGTKVPYFQINRNDLVLNGKNPTLQYGYGGFEISLTPAYSPAVGSAWLENGGVYVLTNIRGGGEYGPGWHKAALLHNRQKAYDDFEAIAEDLIARKVTSPAHLGIMGGSNGGLLMGVMLTQRPDLFGAIVCQVPLLDMKRFHKLLAGASWMAEYGNPDVAEDWDALKNFSPYQNVFKDKKYPKILFTTSTRDDRVHPGHARKMVARMKEQGHDVLYFENIEGGHGGAANAQQQAYMNSLAYTFLWKQLK